MKIRSAEHVAACAAPGDFPEPGLAEVAFLGRSNVGKSSLLNRLVHRRQLARTSKTPGKTRLVHFYRVDLERQALLLVDLPGYGFAAVSKGERRGWRRLVEGYLEGRPSLRTAVLLQDLRREVNAEEIELLDWLASRGIDALVVFTKTDKVRPSKRGARLRAVRASLGVRAGHSIATSAETGLGIEDLWKAIRGRIQ